MQGAATRNAERDGQWECDNSHDHTGNEIVREPRTIVVAQRCKQLRNEHGFQRASRISANVSLLTSPPDGGSAPLASYHESSMSQPIFKDHFSSNAAGYATFRPHYPSELLNYVASLAPRRTLAWDCATGNGQAALPLAEMFERVIATDASGEQIKHATPHPRVSYAVALADASGLEDGSVDLVAVAQALHWFAFDSFFEEVRRVAAPGAALAVWCYMKPTLGDGALERTFNNYYSGTCKPYWAPERAIVDSGYSAIAMPFKEYETPSFEIEASLSLDDFAGYVRTWSATKALAKAIGRDPVIDLREELAEHWGSDATRSVRWPIRVRAARIRDV